MYTAIFRAFFALLFMCTYLLQSFAQVPYKHIIGLIELISTNIANIPPDNEASESHAIHTFHQNTLKYIKARKEDNELFKDIEVRNQVGHQRSI